MKITLEDSTKLRMTFWVSDYVFKMKGEQPTVIWREKEN